MKTEKNLPARAMHGPAAILAVLLTTALWVTQLGIICMHALTSENLHMRVALDDSAITMQMKRIEEKTALIAKEYGFDPERVTASISREQIEELDRQVVRWWTGILATGEILDPPVFHADLEKTLTEDTEFVKELNELAINSTIESVESRMDEGVRSTAVLFRDQLLSAGLHKGERMVDFPEMAELLHKLPGLGGAVCLLLAGGIALILSRKIQLAGQYIGGALSGCGLLMLITLLLFRMLNLSASIGEASLALQAQYNHLMRIVSFEVIGAAVLLMLIGGLGMALAAKTKRMTE